MSFLRRRILSDPSSSEPSRDASPARDNEDEGDNGSSRDDKDEEYKIIPASKLQKLQKLTKKKSSSKRRNVWIFGLGGLFGILLAVFFAGNSDMVDLASLTDLNLDSILDVLPAGLVKDAQALQKHERDAVNYDSFSVGLHAQSQGIKATHPVIMIPGVISTGLESWGTAEESRQYFRKRLWGSWSMMRALVLDKASWKRHIMLDKYTGLDPPGIKLRAAQGFDAADFFITGYWIWNKILENLATIGYDPTNAFTAAYDWRLTYMNYEKRDQYFTRLKAHIEIAVRISNKKVVLLSHSMGSQVLYYFFHWVEAEGYGDGGFGWVDAHVDSWINISGCMLGALKGMPAVLSGEMKDTAQLNAFAVYGLEKFLSRSERADIFRAMPGISSMLPIGGDAVWGNRTWAPDDTPGQNVSYGTFINFRDYNSTANSPANLTVEESLPFLFSHSESWYRNAVQAAYSYGVAHTRAEVERNQQIPSKWVNPLETRLPLAPNLKIYCFYGIGKPTERAYFYREDNDPASTINVTIDTSVSANNADRGVVLGEGDGTVNLLSSGYMCTKGWKMKRYNPAGVKVTVYEMPHEPDRFSPRGGPNTGDHVDILGRSSLNDLILRVAGGKGELINETIHSNIREYADKVKIWDDET
ncbi:phospholipid:diacylglycerol acyltransferase [Coniosporium apollinis CBS 100218]|uniref:Phospholipid:diacylglycerol acyltransferase n=1 Tax=Coniosporium apollinis (strain CBS 100218) TaxID=1168221 RepID=R7YPT6_CONA1|nr:phospholipid:diacylglycerol acyltransferase [Coniosporium apollinis CBS 100218]EON63912.1 phospholipid:diacylglycerol acyltransferase [Coniosporium apollinis CBS 100218]